MIAGRERQKILNILLRYSLMNNNQNQLNCKKKKILKLELTNEIIKNIELQAKLNFRNLNQEIIARLIFSLSLNFEFMTADRLILDLIKKHY